MRLQPRLRMTLLRFLFISVVCTAVPFTQGHCGEIRFSETRSVEAVHVAATGQQNLAGRHQNTILDLKALKSICIPHGANEAETSMAKMLQKKLEQYYHIRLKIHKGYSEPKDPTILLGRKAVTDADIITSSELEEVKYDGFVMKASEDHVAIAGYQPQGTIYGTFAFLRRIGIKFYPWHLGGGIERFTPINEHQLPSFAVSEKPFFELRDLFPAFEDGRFGGTIRKYSLGDLGFANEDPNFKTNGYLGWDHTAGYLVPLHLYHSDHPEYFALKDGRRIPRSTPNLRVSLCMGNPAVHNIASNRALTWIDRQPERRFFMISDGDSPEGCQAPESRALDPISDYYTDRNLMWVNSVARKVKETYPDKTLLTLAYMGTVKPPVKVKPESNVRILYAPWYWNSRISSAVSLNHPLNLTAFKELSGWVEAAPNQVGIYDYPGNFVLGAAERIKSYAKQGVRWIYFNGAEGEMLHWVAGRLLWNPTLNEQGLIEEFTKAFYGPAAPIMNTYMRLRKETIREHSLHNMVIFDHPKFLEESRRLIQALEQEAEEISRDVQIRILEGASDILYTVLRATRPSKPKSTSENFHVHPDHFLSDLCHYIKIQNRLFALYDQLETIGNKSKTRRNETYRNMVRLKLVENHELKRLDWPKNRDMDAVFKAVLDGAAKRLLMYARFEKAFTAPRTKSVKVDFLSSDGTRLWKASSSDASMRLRTGFEDISGQSPLSKKGIAISAPFTRFPVVYRSNKKVHAGRISVERRFDPTLDIAGCRFLDIRLYTSNAVPVSIYIDRGFKLRSDVKLIPGEQTVRVDFASFVDHRFHVPDWQDKISRILFDFWPQDNLYPYPQATDTEIVLKGFEASNSTPFDGSENGLAMTHFRTNRSFMKDFLRDIGPAYAQVMRSDSRFEPLDKHLISTKIAEKYRTVTVHRIVSPISRIITETGEALAAQLVPRFRAHLKSNFDIALPHNVVTANCRESQTNAFCLSENQYSGGYSVRAADGVVRLDGKNEESLSKGLSRYLTANGFAPFLLSGNTRSAVDNETGLFHEFVFEESSTDL